MHTALEKVPADRFGSASALAEALVTREFTAAGAPNALAIGRHAARRVDRLAWAVGAAGLAAATVMAAVLATREEPRYLGDGARRKRRAAAADGNAVRGARARHFC